MSSPGFWDDQENAQQTVAELKSLKSTTGPLKELLESAEQLPDLLEMAEEGEIFIRGAAVSKLGDNARTLVRSKDIGFVYQYHHLLAEFTALENIILPQMILGKSKTHAKGKAEALLHMMGLSNRATHRPARLRPARVGQIGESRRGEVL